MMSSIMSAVCVIPQETKMQDLRVHLVIEDSTTHESVNIRGSLEVLRAVLSAAWISKSLTELATESSAPPTAGIQHEI